MCVCDKCGVKASSYVRIEWDEEMEQNVCGQCWSDFEDSLEEYEEHRRERIAEENEY